MLYCLHRAIFVPSNSIPYRVRGHVSIDQSATSLQNLSVLNHKLLLWTSRELPIWIIGYLTWSDRECIYIIVGRQTKISHEKSHFRFELAKVGTVASGKLFENITKSDIFYLSDCCYVCLFRQKKADITPLVYIKLSSVGFFFFHKWSPKTPTSHLWWKCHYQTKIFKIINTRLGLLDICSEIYMLVQNVQTSWKNKI